MIKCFKQNDAHVRLFSIYISQCSSDNSMCPWLLFEVLKGNNNILLPLFKARLTVFLWTIWRLSHDFHRLILYTIDIQFTMLKTHALVTNGLQQSTWKEMQSWLKVSVFQGRVIQVTQGHNFPYPFSCHNPLPSSIVRRPFVTKS